MLRQILEFRVRHNERSNGVIAFLEFIDATNLKSCSKNFNTLSLPHNAKIRINEFTDELKDILLSKGLYLKELSLSCLASKRHIIYSIMSLCLNIEILELSHVLIQKSYEDCIIPQNGFDIDHLNSDRFKNIKVIRILHSCLEYGVHNFVPFIIDVHNQLGSYPTCNPIMPLIWERSTGMSCIRENYISRSVFTPDTNIELDVVGIPQPMTDVFDDLVTLAAYDRIQQNNLLGTPQITYFKTQFKRHTNFAMEIFNTQSKIHVLHDQPKHLIKNKSPKIKKSYQKVSHYNNNQKYNKPIRIRNQRR